MKNRSEISNTRKMMLQLSEMINPVKVKCLSRVILSGFVTVLFGSCLYASSFHHSGEIINIPILLASNNSYGEKYSENKGSEASLEELIRKYGISNEDGDSLMVYFDLATALSKDSEYEKADVMYARATELSTSKEDCLQIEIERGINRSLWTGKPLYSYLFPLIENAEGLQSPYKEMLISDICSLLGNNYEPSSIAGYPDSPVGFIDKALEYVDFLPVSKVMQLLYDRYQMLLKINHREAIKCVDRMITLFDNKDVLGGMLRNWCVMAYITRGDYCVNEDLDFIGALKYYKEALALLPSPECDGMSTKQTLMLRIMWGFRSMGEYQKAINIGRNLVTLSENNSSHYQTLDYVVELIKTCVDGGYLEEAENLLEQYKKDFELMGELENDYLKVRGEFSMEKKRYADAMADFRVVAKNEKREGRLLSVYENLLIASSHVEKERCREYADTVNNMVMRKISNQILHISPEMRKNWQDVCRNSLKVEIEAQKNGASICGEILQLSLFNKSLLFRTAKEIDKMLAESPEYNEVSAEISKLRNEINRFEMSGQADDANYEELKKRLNTLEWDKADRVANDPEVYKRLMPAIDDVVSHLGDKDLAVEFISLPEGEESENYMAIVFSKKSDPVFVSAYSTKGTDVKEDGKTSSWGWILPYMKNAEDVYFCPDGRQNFQGIEFDYSESRTLASHKYKLHRVFHLADIRKHGSIGNQVVAVGVSDYNSPIGQGETVNRGTMTDLPNVAYEMKLIRRRIKPDNLTVLFNDDATESAFKSLSGRPISALHISTHGVYRDDKTLEVAAGDSQSDDYHIANRLLNADKESLSGLILRQGNLSWKSDKILEDEDDILTSDEIENMSFPNLNLTVLSACDSGLGDVDSEGVWGLQRAFRNAGSKALICSLQKIDDYWSAQFMDAFYEYAGQGRSIYDSFHHAQRVLYEAEPNNPEIWSSFILIE